MLDTPLITNISNTKRAYIYKEIISKCYNINGDRKVKIITTKKQDIKIIKQRLIEMANIIGYEHIDKSTIEKTHLNICNTDVYIEIRKRTKDKNNLLKDIFKTDKQNTLILYREGLEKMPDIWQKAFNTMISEIESNQKQIMCG